MTNLVIIGGSGFAREIFDLATACHGSNPDFRIKGFLSDDHSNIEEMGYAPVLGKVAEYEIQEYDVFFCAIGKVQDRKKTVEIILAKGGKFINLIHPLNNISPSVQLGIGIGIKAFCVLAADSIIEDFTFLQSSVIIGHDVHIGRYCQINSLSFFAGFSRVHDLSTINAGAKLVQNAVVEEGATVGIGSVVLKRVKKGTTVFGMPAKRIV